MALKRATRAARSGGSGTVVAVGTGVSVGSGVKVGDGLTTGSEVAVNVGSISGVIVDVGIGSGVGVGSGAGVLVGIRSTSNSLGGSVGTGVSVSGTRTKTASGVLVGGVSDIQAKTAMDARMQTKKLRTKTVSISTPFSERSEIFDRSS